MNLIARYLQESPKWATTLMSVGVLAVAIAGAFSAQQDVRSQHQFALAGQMDTAIANLKSLLDGHKRFASSLTGHFTGSSISRTNFHHLVEQVLRETAELRSAEWLSIVQPEDKHSWLQEQREKSVDFNLGFVVSRIKALDVIDCKQVWPHTTSVSAQAATWPLTILNYSEPSIRNYPRLGVDYSSCAGFRTMLAKTLEDGFAHTSAAYRDAKDRWLISSFYPVFDKILPVVSRLDLVAERRDHLVGFVAIQIDLNTLFEQIQDHFFDLELQLRTDDRQFSRLVLGNTSKGELYNRTVNDLGLQWALSMAIPPMTMRQLLYPSLIVIFGVLLSVLVLLMARAGRRWQRYLGQELSKREQEVREQLAINSTVFELAPVGLTFIGDAGRDVKQNTVAKELEGAFKIRQQIEIPDLCAIDDGQAKEVFIAAEGVAQGLHLEMYVKSLAVHEGQDSAGMILVYHDVTARENAKNELVKTVGKLRDANEVLASYSHSFSHDLQEPLRRLSSLCDLLALAAGEIEEQERDEMYQLIAESASTIRNLVANFVIRSAQLADEDVNRADNH